MKLERFLKEYVPFKVRTEGKTEELLLLLRDRVDSTIDESIISDSSKYPYVVVELSDTHHGKLELILGEHLEEYENYYVSDYNIDETIVGLKAVYSPDSFDLENYRPWGQLEGVPKELVQYLLEQQVKQGNPMDVEVFEYNSLATAKDGGFDWSQLSEDEYFILDAFNGEVERLNLAMNLLLKVKGYPKITETWNEGKDEKDFLWVVGYINNGPIKGYLTCAVYNPETNPPFDFNKGFVHMRDRINL